MWCRKPMRGSAPPVVFVAFGLLVALCEGNGSTPNSRLPADPRVQARVPPSRHAPRSASAYTQENGFQAAFRKDPALASVFANFAVKSAKVGNELCRNHSLEYLRMLDNFTLWAVQMFDSTTKFPEGLIAGNTYQLGSFDECIGVEARLPGRRAADGRFVGQYCLADVQIIPPEFDRDFHTYDYIKDPNGSAWEGLKYTGDLRVRRRDIFHWAFCIPSSCRPIDLQTALEDALERVRKEHGISMVVHVKPSMCQTKEMPPMSTGSIVVAAVMSTFVILVVIGTFYDVFSNSKKRNNEGILVKAIMSFSAYTNLRNMMKTKTGKEELQAIHGVRFYSMLLIILGHRCMFSFGGPLHNPQFVEYIYTEAVNMFLLNGPIIVDTFFLISGFLTCYLLILELEKRKRYNVFMLYLHRYIRLTPVYMMIVAFYATLFRRVGRGPLWEAKVGVEADRCQMNWWTNLLYINNYVNTKNLCMFQSWYVTCDMHFFLLAPLLVYPLWRWPRYGRIALFLITLLSIVVPFAVTYIEELDAVLLLYMTALSDPVSNYTFRSIYITSHNRASPYYLGMMWGYIYYKIKAEKIKIPRMTYLGLWVVLLTTALASMFGAWIFYLPGRPYSRLEAAFYGGLHRAGWGLSLGWLVVASDIGLGGPLTPLFKWKAVIPLSRLTYCAFLIHGGVQLFSIATLRTPEYMTFYKLFWMTSADVFFTFLFSLLVSLIFESPICGLEKIFLKSGKKREVDRTQETVLVPFENYTTAIPQ